LPMPGGGGKLRLSPWASDADIAYARAHPEIYDLSSIPAGRASGGSFSGWAMVGDAPGGIVTPYTEYVYAPHGGVVYNQAQMSGKSAPPMSSGGIISPSNDLAKELRAMRDDMNRLIGEMPIRLKEAVQKIVW